MDTSKEPKDAESVSTSKPTETNSDTPPESQHKEDIDIESLVEEYDATPPQPYTRSAAPPSSHNANKTAGPPTWSMPAVAGELSPSPPISPSPAPTMKTRSSTSRVNCMLDIQKSTTPVPPPGPGQGTAKVQPTMTDTTPQCDPKQMDQGVQVEPKTSPPTRPKNN